MIPNLSLSHAAIKSYDCHEAIPIGASLSDWALAAAADDAVSLHRKRPKPHALLLSLRERVSDQGGRASEPFPFSYLRNVRTLNFLSPSLLLLRRLESVEA